MFFFKVIFSKLPMDIFNFLFSITKVTTIIIHLNTKKSYYTDTNFNKIVMANIYNTLYSTFEFIVLVTQLCLTLCDPMDHSLPGSSVHGILQARILEWVAISFYI